MIAELGQFALILAFVVALFQSVAIFAGLRTGDAVVHGFARTGAIAQFVLVLAAFACLTALFAMSDFTALVVAENSHTDKPFLYKLTGVWGNHEGSMLLWVLILTAYTAALAWSAKPVEARLISLTFAVQSLITAAFTAFLLFTSNPFARLWPGPENGQDLNPLLQDPGLASHPPMLYAGYVGFSITFSFALAALIDGRVDARWARIVRPWALAAWTFLTIGIALGASWAYYELGWGGWWAWDPVENASLMPWLAGTAFIHSLRVMEKRDTLKAWSILLALLTFALSMAGTFLVRSGVLTSVHAFAVDPERGVFILAILIALIGGSLLIYGLRAGLLKPTGVFSAISRESTLLINNLVLVVACGLVFFGTFYPLFITTVSDETVTIGAPFYNNTFNPFIGALLVLVPISGLLAWKRGRLTPVLKDLAPAAIAALVGGLAAFWIADRGLLAGALGTALAIWIALGVLIDLAKRCKLFQIDFKASLARAARLPLGIWGMAVAHFGVAVVVFAITGVSAWKQETSAFLMPGQHLDIRQLTLTLDDVEQIEGPNYVAERGYLTARRDQQVVSNLTAERRLYLVRGMATTESAIHARLTGDIYVTIGQPNPDRGWPVFVYIYPFAIWLWIGSGILGLGGLLSISDRGRRALAVRKQPREAQARPEPAE
ncbi:cytochrome C biogenesis protein CcmF [Maricaulis sp. W15]|uniref:heme lyase CcmF/NrfE family subunit n=1 Tax=Maricaulis sp. W15 TaxID=1772333 RepID=UPI000948C4A9|nr:heme lyase CcmF/NrfE family subunit [Maricaulis sp. W15]OLF77875.1 cytochrome C biogenesis protein CcmF [Maricaulis sp. W15]